MACFEHFKLLHDSNLSTVFTASNPTLFALGILPDWSKQIEIKSDSVFTTTITLDQRKPHKTTRNSITLYGLFHAVLRFTSFAATYVSACLLHKLSYSAS